MKRPLSVLVLLVILMFGSGMVPCLASSNILFILDSSGSMWGKVDNVAKVTTAKKVLTGLLRDLPRDTNVGLMAYGHRKKEDCKDVELLAPIGTNDPAKLAAHVESLQPKGKTPLSYSLEQSLPLFASLKGQSNSIVLVSDGKETCGGDPCKVAGKLAAAGLDIKIHVVGFDVSAEERKQLECVADQGKGRYFNAESSKGLEKALAEVKKEVVKAPPPKKEEKEYFRDDFDGEELAEHWEVLNPDPDSYIVEDGKLLIIGATAGRLEGGKVPNIIRLTKPLPKGDWVITVKFTVGYQTGKESSFLSLYENKDNFLAIGYDSWSYYEKVRGARTFFNSCKVTKGKKKTFSHVIWGGAGGKPYSPEDPPNPIFLQIAKKGRKYIPAIKINVLPNEKERKWVERQSWSILRQKGNLALGILQQEKVNGETTMTIDWVKIETIE